MSDVFGSRYAQLYDTFYREKDYVSECDLLEAAQRRHGTGEFRRILDLGCGTGGHAFELARRGFRVDGVDLSEAMLRSAREKAAQMRQTGNEVAVQFHRGDLRSHRMDATYDAATMMFAVLGYQTTNDHVLAALRNARRHLRAEGLLLFDVWYGPAVLTVRPDERSREFTLEGRKIRRLASTRLDTFRHTATVDFRIEDSAGAAGAAIVERHLMRYFFAQELVLFLSCSGLELRAISAFPSLDQPVGDDTWNAFVVARAA